MNVEPELMDAGKQGDSSHRSTSSVGHGSLQVSQSSSNRTAAARCDTQEVKSTVPKDLASACTCVIQVTQVKNAIAIFVAVCKRAFMVNAVVELVGIGNAMATTVSLSEILQASGDAIRARVATSTIEVQPEVDAEAQEAEGVAPGQTRRQKIQPRTHRIQIWMRRKPKLGVRMLPF
mmetsp:Transcript_56257/g.115051  ORF Transcript_56257/g.115051 Transcript_56257/m.115051 type:complete len:177 (+) Transcript_56257:20-550(+)